MKNKALIFLNGDLPDPASIKKLITKETYLIAADGGTDHTYKLGLKPRAVIGDFDSAVNLPESAKLLAPKDKINGQQIEIDDVIYLKYPLERDYTDGELALDFAMARGFSEIVIVCSLGNEIDHVLGNIFMIGKDKYAGQNIKILQPNYEAFIISGEAKITGRVGQKISIMPLFGKVKVASCKGLKYDLTKYDMRMEAISGISNEFSEKTAKIKITTGKFLAIKKEHILLV